MKDLQKRLPAPLICTSCHPQPRPMTLDDTMRDILTFGLAGMVAPGAQVTFPIEAYKLFPRGCTCPTTDGGGDCPWCEVFYSGPEIAEVEIA